MKKYMLMALLTFGLMGTIVSFGQDGPKEEKKDRKMMKKEHKMHQKSAQGSERKAYKKKEKAVKKSDKSDIKDEMVK